MSPSCHGALLSLSVSDTGMVSSERLSGAQEPRDSK